MIDPFTTLSRARQAATGSWLDLAPPNVEPMCASDVEFDGLVRDYYIFFNERFSQEVKFLVRRRPSRQIDDLRRLIYNLRTAANHTDNPKAELESARWRQQYGTPQEAANALAERLGQGIELLSRIAVAVSRDPREAGQWRQLLTVDVAAVFSAVERDFACSFTEGNRRRMVRLVERRLEVQPLPVDRRQLVAEYCAQEVLADRRPLPVPYSQVLDALGLLGTTKASGVILVAHSVAEIDPKLKGDAFITRVEQTWRVAGARERDT